MSSIDNIYKNFMKFLNSNDKGNTLGGIFRPENSLELMFQTLWCFPESKIFFRVADPKLSMYRKGRRESIMLREEGNRLYKEGKLDKALSAYNYSILSAPFSTHDSADKEDKNPTECLSLAYANRSAVLFEMNQNNDAILDIDRAIAYGYPKTKISKLFERKAKCFMKQGSFEDAIKVLRTILRSLMTNKNNESYSNHINVLLHACKSKDETHLKKNNYWNCIELFYTGPPNLSVPRCVTKISNKGKQSQLSDAIKVQYTSSRGRHMVATRNILPGEVLLSEEAQYSIVTLDAKQRAYCCNCLRRTPIILPCPTCSLVVFCSVACQKVATSQDGFHRKECSILPSLICMNPSPNVALAFRALCSFSLSEIKQVCSSDKENIGTNQKLLGTAFIDLGSNYETLYNLEGNLKFRNTDTLIATAINAVLLVKILLKNLSFFGENMDDVSADTYAMNNRNIIYLVGAYIMRIILNIQCNSHCSKELTYMQNAPVETSTMSTIGHSVFSFLSLVNHSCVPNIFTSNLGNRKVMFTISCIAAGEEICDSYGERYASHDRNIRRAALLENYYFQCRCPACLEDWAVFSSLPTDLVFKCQKCHKEIQHEDNCSECNNSNASIKQKKKKKKQRDTKNGPVRNQQNALIIREYNHMRCHLTNEKPLEEYILKISNFIHYLEKYTVTPNKPLIEAQENLLKLFDLYGSQIILIA